MWAEVREQQMPVLAFEGNQEEDMSNAFRRLSGLLPLHIPFSDLQEEETKKL